MGARAKRKRNRLTRATSPLDALKRKMKDDGLLRGREVIAATAGEEKMSAILLRFIEPYRRLVEGYQGMERLVSVAMVAWNAAILDAAGQTGFLDQLIESALPKDEAVRRDFRETIHGMIQRKQRYFGNYQRIVVSYKVTNRKHDYHLSVASMLAPGDATSKTG